MHPKYQGHCAGIRKAGSMREPTGQVGGTLLVVSIYDTRWVLWVSEAVKFVASKRRESVN